MNRTHTRLAALVAAVALALGTLGVGLAAAQSGCYPPAPSCPPPGGGGGGGGFPPPSPAPSATPSPRTSPSPKPSVTPTPTPRVSKSPAAPVSPRPRSTTKVTTTVTVTSSGGTVRINVNGTPVTMDTLRLVLVGNSSRTPLSNGSASRQLSLQPRAGGDGYTAELPADLEPGEYEVTVSGTDASGTPVSETQTVAIGDARNAASGVEDGFVLTNLHLVLMLGLGLLGAAGLVAVKRRS